MTAVRINLGDEVLKQLLVDQQPVFQRERAAMAREMVRGGYPIAVGMNKTVLQEFLDQGLAKNIKNLAVPEARYTTAHGLWLFNRAPHPNAAKVLINWSLTKAGQEAWSKAYQYNSLRADVAPYDTDSVAVKDSVWMSNEENIPKQEDTRKFLESLVKY